MKNKLLITVLLLDILVQLGGHIVHAQSAQAVTFQGGAASSTCLTPVVGQTMLCVGTDDIKGSWNGAAYVSLKPGAASAPTLTLNGTTKALPGPFTVVATSGAINSPAVSIVAQ